jgi:heme-degrading monooxygenase HmoA
MIRHSVAFRLRHPVGSKEEAAFLEAADALAGIPGVQRFEKLRETSPKNDYAFALAMEFSDAEAYARYNDHPVHVAFVRQRWATEVADFLEIDTEPLALPAAAPD